MMNKNLKLARKLRGESISDLIAEEVDYVLAELVKEFGTASLGVLLLKVVEKYHKTLMKSKAKRGAKQKWSPLLRAMIRVEVDARRNSKTTLKAVINELNKDPLWSVFIGESDESFRRAYKEKQDKEEIKFAQHVRQEEKYWQALVKEEVERFRD